MTENRMQRTDGAIAAAPGYDATAKTLHWLVALLVLAQFVVAWLMPGIGRNTPPSALVSLHFSLGVTILAVIAIRLVHRLGHPVPLQMSGSPPWEQRLARATHIAFYVLLLVGPVLGWASASAHQLPVTLFGLVTLPDIAAPKARWALTAGDVHTYAMWCMLGLVGLHAAAALYHHFIRHDGVLRRMLPASSA